MGRDSHEVVCENCLESQHNLITTTTGWKLCRKCLKEWLDIPGRRQLFAAEELSQLHALAASLVEPGVTIHLELITGLLEQLGTFDYVVMGHKNPLRHVICKETGCVFQRKSSQSAMYPLSSWELLEAPHTYRWKYIACVNIERRRYPESQYSRISEAIAYGLRPVNAQSIAILPLAWRLPDYVALGTISALWTLAYAHCLNARSPDLSHRRFVIVSQAGVEPYQQVIENDFRLFWRYLKKINRIRNQTIRNMPFCTCYDLSHYQRQPIRFDVTERVLSSTYRDG